MLKTDFEPLNPLNHYVIQNLLVVSHRLVLRLWYI